MTLDPMEATLLLNWSLLPATPQHEAARRGNHWGWEHKMQEQKSALPTSDELLAESHKPLTKKDRVVGIALALVFLALCAAMWLHPDILGMDPSDLSGRGGRKIARIIEALWSRPAGVLLGIVGLVMIYGSITKPGVRPQGTDQTK